MIDDVLCFIKSAGNKLIKIRKDKGLLIDYKSKTPVGMVTKADKTISKMFEDFVKKNFKGLNYFIVDEETFKNYGD